MLELAGEMKQAYASHYVGGQNTKTLKNIISRYEGGSDDPLDDRLDDFIRTKGPYLQALDLPQRSEKRWVDFASGVDGIATKNGLNQALVDTFRKAGIERLYNFQEETIEAVLEDRHTLVTAGTGRGKTESWLIPILQFICEAKEGKHDEHPPQGVKCLLTYPTKALAQDQLKRLIEYLYEINAERPPEKQITIGIFDGDTPPSPDTEAYEYLSTAYKFFECPCEYCDSSLTVEQRDEGFVVTHAAETEQDVSLEYIKLTRDEIVDTEVDILLTNPDTVNYRLFNINSDQEQEIFAEQPKYVVFDEIHEYSELFGSYTSILMRRYLKAREERLGRGEGFEDDLTIIGASATVENRESIFQRVNPFIDIDPAIVKEDPRKLEADLPDTVPSTFLESEFDTEELDPESSQILQVLTKIVTRDIDSEPSSNQFQRELSEALYTQIIEGSDDELDFVRGLYSVLREDPRQPAQLVEYLTERTGLDTRTAERAVENFIEIGRLSGVLESRIHLFSWPLDGYYTCLNCAAVYDTPQSSCPSCNHHFVTKLSYCNHCGEEGLESWFCPNCERLSPLNVTSAEGRFEYFSDHHCSSCDTETIRVVWRPFYECSGCGDRQQIDRIQRCHSCDTDAPLVLSNDQTEFVCTNPSCDATRPATETQTCGSCNSDELTPLSDDEVLFCRECGDYHEETDAQSCDCGGELTPKRYLGWACGDRSCDEVYFGNPPNTCECGNRRFVRTGLLDVNAVEYCSECDTDYLPETDCGCDSPNHSTAIRGFQSYKMVDENGRIRNPTDFKGAVPCYHPRRSYRKSRRYDSMIRGPGNAAVTTSQYLLRNIADTEDPNSFREAKLLSFADSQSDMKQLQRDFEEPEERLFFTQLLVEAIKESDEGWVALEDVQEHAIDSAREYEEMLLEQSEMGGDSVLSRLTGYQQSVSDFISDEIGARVLYGRFNNRRRNFLHLPSDGVVDVRLDIDITSLEKQKRTILGTFYNQANRYVGSIADEVSVEDVTRHVEDLLDEGVLRRLETDSGYLVGLDESRIECSLVDAETPIEYDPSTGSFSSTLAEQFGHTSGDLVDFEVPIEERARFTNSHFNLTAYRCTYSSPMMLLARAYYGSTEKDERRRIEYQFREGRFPNFLSSGPAMELGVDIGELDTLLLYGTPPNTNSYLQRVGRAGRASGSSLVHSVSQRNPIDYYYYEQPAELIDSEPQPVPLNETNEEVLRVSLVWSLLDFISATQWIPWRREQSAITDQINFDGEITPRSEPKPNDILTFSNLLSADNDEIHRGGDDAPLEAIRQVVESNESKARDWLRDILGFSACRVCGHKHVAGYEGECRLDDCDGQVDSIRDEYASLIENALESYAEEFIDLYLDFTDDLIYELEEIQSELNELRLNTERQRRSRGRGNEESEESEESRAEMLERKERLTSRSQQLNRYLDRLDSMDFRDFLSDHSTTPFSLRSVSDSVTYELIGEEFEPATDNLLSRSTRIALSELHPGAAYLHADRNTYVITEVVPDELKTAELTADVPDSQICSRCGTEHDLDASSCEHCGSSLRRLKTIVPRRATAHKSDLKIGTKHDGSALTPRSVYRNSDVEVQSTYAPVESDVAEFTPEEGCQFHILDGGGTPIGRLEYGGVRIRSSTSTFRTSYAGGGTDPTPSIFEMCGVDSCNGVIAQNDETSYCTRHPEHDTSETYAVRLATQFDTNAVRIQFDDESTEHAFAHGLRIALQYIGGVGIRDVPESIEDDGTYIYDNEAGGAGITRLLTMRDGEEYHKFNRATELMAESFDCDCDGGCPFCIYQYQCTNRNDPHTLDKDAVIALLNQGMELVPLEDAEVQE